MLRFPKAEVTGMVKHCGVPAMKRQTDQERDIWQMAMYLQPATPE
jgi:hypothetical protein